MSVQLEMPLVLLEGLFERRIPPLKSPSLHLDTSQSGYASMRYLVPLQYHAMCRRSFLGPMVGIPSKECSIDGTSSNTRASSSGGIGFFASQSHAPFARDTPPGMMEPSVATELSILAIKRRSSASPSTRRSSLPSP
eukprot:CAMPEP_0182913440 /NCGR_PEP_ID=MMETSP0034_2-20130328/38042_1 /TAXON_ID=156128 /ORGANISM="Nephroselmis pyriformis, Strain CCMP717" /LENGTH=136 /DNA_ID=CAMNT_0025050165 /DNA_START=246 /DNA_END=653 /DNA_ORIENTATION=-